ncbi:MAG: bifunctional diaminohydroxyphosphoribosylaminopyrimidine deaminase/5-amino-6-(5-phosphoribosylamino)uracil reductase RibD [Bacteroidota bacterium]|jgi:diaminohydroxyphosphoribosylaminopyrimidine deaminase/5-amino-6-(5-phosphoribosylamino)uracil reductase
MRNNINEKYIRLCFELARQGEGFVSPNPLVGCVIVRDDKIVVSAYHEKYGSFHAERNAILRTYESLAGATLYCNLEPCMHTNKQTPPCVPLIISSGITRVVISNEDTNPNVNGRGIQQLKNAGIDVVTSILEKEGTELNKFYFKTQKCGIPYITLKIAASMDGMITEKEGKQTWLTGIESKKFVHRLRSVYDAVLIGANTINIDNPLLTVREASGRNPKRIIIDGKLSSRLESKVFNDSAAETFVFCSDKLKTDQKKSFVEKNINLIEIETDDNMHIKLTDMLSYLSSLKINSVLVEGGKNIFKQFFNLDFFDELIHLQSPAILSKGLSVVDSRMFSNLVQTKKLILGNDIMFHYKNLSSKCLQA